MGRRPYVVSRLATWAGHVRRRKQADPGWHGHHGFCGLGPDTCHPATAVAASATHVCDDGFAAAACLLAWDARTRLTQDDGGGGV